MKKYLNRIDKIEQALGIDNPNQQWLVSKLDDDVVKVTKLSVGNAPQNTQHLTASEFEAFKSRLTDEQLINVEWIT